MTTYRIRVRHVEVFNLTVQSDSEQTAVNEAFYLARKMGPGAGTSRRALDATVLEVDGVKLKREAK